MSPIHTNNALIRVGGSPPSFSGILLRRSSSQLIPDATPAAISWQTVVYNLGGDWFPGAPTLVIVPPGVFRVLMFAAATWDSALGTFHTLRFIKNGAFAGLPVSAPETPRLEQSVGAPVIEVVPGDTLSAGVLHDGGGAVNILTTTTQFGVWAIR